MQDLLKYFWYSRKIKSLRFALLGVRKAYQRRGLETLLYVESFTSAKNSDIPAGKFRGSRKTISKSIKQSFQTAANRQKLTGSTK